MNAKFVMLTTVLLLGLILLGACSGQIPVSGPGTESTRDSQVLQAAQATATQIAMEAEIAALKTQVAQLGVATQQQNEATAVSPAEVTATPKPPTATAVPPTATAVPPTRTPTATPLPCNAATFVADVSIPDGTELEPGTSFTKTWRLKNIGACTWTESYDLVFVSGDQMDAPDTVAMPGDVGPGQVIDVSVDLVAPDHEGSYRGNWKLRDSSGRVFGLGRRGDTFFVDIRVAAPSSSNGPLDFVARYCQATWTSSAGRLPCQGENNDSRGFIRRINDPVLESGYQDDEPALLTNPQMVENGVIRGKYPAVRVENGYKFVSVIGCSYKATGCDVTFLLSYQIGSGPVHNYAKWHEVYDKEFHLVGVDLSALAGQDVKFILNVIANGDSSNNKALWLAPHIEVSPIVPN